MLNQRVDFLDGIIVFFSGCAFTVAGKITRPASHALTCAAWFRKIRPCRPSQAQMVIRCSNECPLSEPMTPEPRAILSACRRVQVPFTMGTEYVLRTHYCIQLDESEH